MHNFTPPLKQIVGPQQNTQISSIREKICMRYRQQSVPKQCTNLTISALLCHASPSFLSPTAVPFSASFLPALLLCPKLLPNIPCLRLPGYFLLLTLHSCVINLPVLPPSYTLTVFTLFTILNLLAYRLSLFYKHCHNLLLKQV